QAAPVKLGTSGGNSADIGTKVCCIGTLGSLWTKTGVTRPVILSNNHVLDRSGNGAAGEAINQPLQLACTAPSAPPPLTVALLTQGAALKPVANEPGACPGSKAPLCGHAPSNVDAAIAEIAVGQVDLSGTILDLGPVGATSIAAMPPSSTIGVAALGEAVGKSGRTTGLTCSTIQSLNMTTQVDYEATCGSGTPAFTALFTNQVTISGGSFSAGGDSGSLIVDTTTARPMALLYGGNTVSTVANPIQDVINAFGGPAAFTIIGGGDHAVSCAHTATASAIQVGSTQAALVPEERKRVAAVQTRRSQALMRDFGVTSVGVGPSADNPREGALVLHVSGKSVPAVPAVIDGVRTRLIFDNEIGATVSAQEINRITAVKEAHVMEFMGKPGIQGFGVSISEDNPAEGAISIYVIEGVNHPVIPPVIDGIRTKVFEGTRFKAY
ncbi:MAG TPA: hypothetical protein VH724_07020, partial [Candidatus Angelobacter sp.]|nr:hypothetical protein [Candidatus Angelobacter sp.]